MVTNPRLLRALQLQRIANTSRKFSSTASAIPTTTPITPVILKSLPEHRPLLSVLLSHNVPSKLAKACADRYDRYADQLRSDTEIKLAPYLLDYDDGQHARIYTVFLNNYSRALWEWAQSILDAALRSLKRDSAELRDWDVTYPPPLWLPSPPDQHSYLHAKTQHSCPFSSYSAPAHAFPTTYPPPLRPCPGIPPVQWTRTPPTPPGPPSTSVADLDSLCTRFMTALVIGEQPSEDPETKASIFSLPAPLNKGINTSSPLKGRSKRGNSRSKIPRETPTPKLSSSPPSCKAPKSRQLSVPPSFPSTKPTSRETSVPPLVSSSQYPPGSQPPSSTTRHTTPTTPTPLPNTPTTCDQDAYFYPNPSTPPCLRSPLEPVFERTAYTLRGLSNSPTGPTTPPTLLPDLFSEPIVTTPTSVHLSSGSSLMPITDPFLQFRPQCDYFSDPFPSPALDYSGLTPRLTAGGLFCKNAFDTPLGFDQFFHGISAPITFL